MAAPSYVYDLLASEANARWNAASPVGTPVTITYRFSPTQPSSTAYPNYTPFTATEIAATRQALALISSFTKITFVETTAANAQFEFGNADLSAYGSGVGGRAEYAYSNSGIFHASIALSNSGPSSLANSDFVPGDISGNDLGGSGWQILLHEIGHALGLKHPFETNNAGDPNSVLPSNVDDHVHTLMSYTPFQPSNVAVVSGTESSYSYSASSLKPQTYGLFDMAALQYLYGVQTTPANQVYAFSPTEPVFATIFDSGPDSTIDISAFTQGCIVDVNPGVINALPIKQVLPYGITIPYQYDGSAALTLAYGSAVRNVIGGSGNDSLTGNDANNRLDGGGGGDTMLGGAGSDTYVVDNAGDRVFELISQGVDLVQSSVSFNLGSQYIENLTLTGTATIDATGNSVANGLVGNDAANRLDGGAGADVMRGGLGNDTYIVDNVGDRVFETISQGVDLVLSSVSFNLGGQYLENLTLTGTGAATATGNSFANTLVGNASANTLFGVGGNDVLNGAGGKDLLNGGAGADTFSFTTALGASNVDRISDFSAVDDTIRLAKSIFTMLTPGVLAATAFKDLSTGVADASDRILYNKGTGVLSYDADGSGAASATIQFATLDNKAAITHLDFLIV